MVDLSYDREPVLARAEALVRIGRAEQALAELAQLPPALAEDRRAFQLRVEALVALDRWDDVVAVARQGLAATGPDPGLLSGLGLALQSQGKHADAERALLDGLALDPEDVSLLCRYALLCLTVGQADKAGRLLDLAAQEDPHAAIVYATRVELAFARGDDRDAERYSQEFLAEYPQHPLALSMHGRSAAVRGRIVPAYGLYRQAAAADPTDAPNAEAALELRLAAHPLLVPLRPLYRLGPFKSWALAAGLIVAFQLLGWSSAYVVAGLAWLAYVAYSWVAPSVVRRLLGVPAPADQRPWVSVTRWVLGTLALVLALGCTGLAVVDIGPAVRAAAGHGTPGTIVLTRTDCRGASCDWFGDFTSDDGSIVSPDAAMQEGVPDGAKVGDRLRALDTGARDGVYPERGSTEWVFLVLYLVAGLVVIAAWVIAVPIAAIRRRRR